MINKHIFHIVIGLLFIGCSSTHSYPPEFVIGNFQDDYGIQYQISKDTWVQQPNSIFHIDKWDPEEQYLIARNDSENPSDAGQYSRIDWIVLENMHPYTWGFCITSYNAESLEEAKNISPPDRKHPKKGCNGFPFSRMKVDEM